MRQVDMWSMYGCCLTPEVQSEVLSSKHDLLRCEGEMSQSICLDLCEGIYQSHLLNF